MSDEENSYYVSAHEGSEPNTEPNTQTETQTEPKNEAEKDPELHACTSPTLFGEPADVYREQRESLQKDLQPRNSLEKELVDYMAICNWRVGRLVNLEWAVINSEMRFPDPGEPTQWCDTTARAYRALIERSRCLDFMGRAEKRAFAAFENALNLFLTVRKEFPPKQENPKQENPTL
jgi:hypothetical protein